MRLLVIETSGSGPERQFPRALEDDGFRVHTARDPVDAKWLASHGDYSAILLEAERRDSDRYSILRAIRRTKSTPVC
jgi:DNA-binding response OmpR family regulator